MTVTSGVFVSVLVRCGADGRSGNVTSSAPHGAEAQLAYRDGAGPGLALEDALRSVPRREGVQESSGWAGQQTC